MSVDSPPSRAAGAMKERWPWPRATLADPGLVLAPGLVVLVLVAALSAYLILEADQTAILARSANELRLINLQLNNKIADAETGQRGYLLTSDPAYLAPYKEAVRDIPQLSRKLIDITAGNPARQALAVHAEELAQLKLGDIQKTVDLQNRGDAPAAIATVREDTGKKYFDELRGILSELSEQATADVDGRRQESMSQRRLLMGVTLAGLILSAILSVIALTRARRQIGELRERHRTLADLNEMLEHRVAERTAELQQAKLETERERDQIRALLTDVNHRIGNNLQLVSSMLGFHARFAVGEETRNTLQAARNQVQSIASAQRRLRLLAGSDEVELGSFLEGLLQDMRDTLTPDRPIKVELSASPANASSKTAVSIGVIVNELISNAVKHAFPDGQEGCVRVALTTGENGRLEEIVVEDDGVGFSLPVGTEPSGLGGKIVQALSHSLNASLSVETAAPGRERPGTRIRLILRELEPAA